MSVPNSLRLLVASIAIFLPQFCRHWRKNRGS